MNFDLPESEETEVKDIEWLKEHITIILGGKVKYKDKNVVDDKYFVGLNNAYVAVLEMLESLDVETLTPEWIDELIHYSTDQDAFGNIVRIEIVPAKYLRNLLVPKQGITTESTETVEKLMEISKLGMKLEFLSGLSLEEIVDKMGNGVLELVPKQELPVIPKFVADWIKKAKRYHSISWLLNYENIKGWSHELTLWCFESGNDDNLHKLARAWLDGYEIEQEPKYYAKVKGWGANGNDGHAYYSGKFPLSLTMSTESVAHTKDEWKNYGVYEDNADFVKVEELEE